MRRPTTVSRISPRMKPLLSELQNKVTAIQTLKGHLWLKVGRDFHAKLTSVYKERVLPTPVESIIARESF